VYAVVGCLADVHQMFDEMRNQDVVAWTAIIAASSRYGHKQEALA